ncbi:MAG: serine hydrolase [Blautia sp.]|nr:serine hydrolase [Blautia sp.]MCM1200564.1 serine hydrolase [Bacteroides fragilis]
MKCTNNRKKKVLAAFLGAVFVLTGCGAGKYEMPYNSNYQVSSFKLVQTADANAQVAETFAADLCVVDKNISNSEASLSDVAAAALFDVNGLNTLYARNANEQLPPASLTKVMTALVALKHGSPEQLLTAGENVLITEPGAQLCGIKPGDTMTLQQALYVLLLYSANDVAVMIAEGVSGSVAAFVEQMNEEAQELGATNCHFTNPNGLTEEGHYMTAYDLYLIFSEALQYDLFNEIIQTVSYSTTYHGSDGSERTMEINNTNQYLAGNYTVPEHITVIGGKTGTTKAAGHCLLLLARDNSGKPYISVILNSESTESLYADMTELLGIIE